MQILGWIKGAASGGLGTLKHLGNKENYQVYVMVAVKTYFVLFILFTVCVVQWVEQQDVFAFSCGPESLINLMKCHPSLFVCIIFTFIDTGKSVSNFSFYCLAMMMLLLYHIEGCIW